MLHDLIQNCWINFEFFYLLSQLITNQIERVRQFVQDDLFVYLVHPEIPHQPTFYLLLQQFLLPFFCQKSGVTIHFPANKFSKIYLQHFCGYDFLQWNFPINPSSLTRFRNRLGLARLEKILSLTVAVAAKSEAVKVKDLKKIIVDTTVMPKNIEFPTDSQINANLLFGRWFLQEYFARIS